MSEQLDFLSQLTECQREELLRRAAEMEYLAQHKIAVRPDMQVVGVLVRWNRTSLGWKKETLASFAGVSVSTVERVERGQRISDECLDRVAVALGRKPGEFTKPRVPLVWEAAVAFAERWMAPFEGRRWVAVEPVRKQRQIVEFSDCHIYLIDGDRLEVDVSDDLDILREEIDLVAFIRDDRFISRSERERRQTRRRDLYKEILGHIDHIERVAEAVALGGTYQAKTDHPYLREAMVAITGFFPKKTDPAAITRRQLLVPERIDLLLAGAAPTNGSVAESHPAHRL